MPYLMSELHKVAEMEVKEAFVGWSKMEKIRAPWILEN